jgi:hypothetical protein
MSDRKEEIGKVPDELFERVVSILDQARNNVVDIFGNDTMTIVEVNV